MPRVSVIVPSYNHSKYLEKRLDSIFNQTYQNFEVILLDDCSTDNSIEQLNLYSTHPKISHFIINIENSGNTFKQWAKGIDLAKGEYIWIAESDDYCDLRFLEKAMEAIQIHPKAGLVYCQSWSIDATNSIIDSWVGHTSDLDKELFKNDFVLNGVNFIENFLVHKNVIPNASAVVFKKAIYDRVKGLNYKIKFCGDWFLWLKISALSEIVFVAESLNYFRFHQNSVIYKALNSSTLNESYSEKFDKTMRKIFSKWLRSQRGNFSIILSQNNNYISKEFLSEAHWHLNNNHLIPALYAGINYSLMSKNLHFFKFILISRLKKLYDRSFN